MEKNSPWAWRAGVFVEQAALGLVLGKVVL